MSSPSDYALLLAALAGGATAGFIYARKKKAVPSASMISEPPTPGPANIGTAGLGIVALAEVLFDQCDWFVSTTPSLTRRLISAS